MLGKNKKWEELQEAVRQDNAEQVTAIIGDLSAKRRKYYDACSLAVQHNASKALRALLEAGEAAGLVFYYGLDKDKPLALQLLKAASSSSDPAPLLCVLYDMNEKTTGRDHRLNDYDFLNKEAPSALIQACLEKNPNYFDFCVKNIGLHSTEKLKFILTFTSGSPNAQFTLDTALVQVAETGDIEKAEALLERQADPNYAVGQALLRAGEGGHQDMVNLLLPLIKLDIYGNDIVTQLQQTNVPAAIIAAIEAATQKAIATPPVPQETEIFSRVDADTLAETQTLPDGSTLMTLFNFRTQQQKNIRGDAAPALVNFTDMDKNVIKDMREKLDALNEKPQPRPRTPVRALKLS